MSSNHTDVILGLGDGPEAFGAAMPAIDLYSGIGGWTLGLKMAGIEVVSGYEWWDQANRTYEINFGRRPVQADIRTLPLDGFPTHIDVVVGSPPCTQFSFANRGGNGDIGDGLRDIRKFLEVVEHASPRYWVMENVPRVARILEKELGFGGRLERFGNLVRVISVVDMADFGLPQRRRRMLAGDFPIDLLDAYKGQEAAPTLGEVVASLRADPAIDPIYGLVLKDGDLRGNRREVPLSLEEARLNRAMKQQHPFYNVMSYPDPLDRTARTVTALCTRVSRESIIVDDESYGFRRLTLRERATLQGFPITFQFSGRSYSDALKMVGNAIPPVLTYYVGQSLIGASPRKVKTPRESSIQNALPEVLPEELESKLPKDQYPATRRFRAVIPGLRFGSGLRFELVNRPIDHSMSWEIGFYFGTSKNIQTIELDERLLDRALSAIGSRAFRAIVGSTLRRIEGSIREISGQDIQSVWTHNAPGTHPFSLIDELGKVADRIHAALPASDGNMAEQFVLRELGHHEGEVASRQREKLRKNAIRIFSGFIMGGWFNASSGLKIRSSRGLAKAV